MWERGCGEAVTEAVAVKRWAQSFFCGHKAVGAGQRSALAVLLAEGRCGGRGSLGWTPAGFLAYGMLTTAAGTRAKKAAGEGWHDGVRSGYYRLQKPLQRAVRGCGTAVGSQARLKTGGGGMYHHRLPTRPPALVLCLPLLRLAQPSASESL